MRTFCRLGIATGFVCLAVGPMTPLTLAEAPQPCAQIRQINGFKYVDEKTAIFETGPGRKFKISFAGKCRDLKWAYAIRVESNPAMCLKPGDVVVVSRDGVIPERCVVSNVEALPAN